MTCPICGRWAPADRDTGYDVDEVCPTCHADGWTEIQDADSTRRIVHELNIDAETRAAVKA